MTIPTRRTVSITGDFTSWGVGRPLKRTDDGFAVTLPVKPGTRLVYKFIVDGAWMLDPDLPFETGADGNRNHVIVVPDSPGIRAAPTRGSLRSTESESVPPRQELPWWLWFTPRVFGPPQTRTDGPKMFLGFGAVERFSLTEVAPEPVRSVTGHDSRREGVSIKLMALDPLQDPFLVPFARRLARAELAAVSAAVHGASISLSDRTLQVPSPSLVSFLQSATRELRGMSPPWLPSSHGCRGFVSDSRVAQIRRFCGGGSASLRPGDDVAVLIKRKVVEDGLRSAGATTKKSKLCRFYRAGSCRDGDRCAFSHGEKGSPSSRTPSTVALAAGGPAFVFFIEAIVLLRPAALPLSFSPSVWGKLADLDSCAAPLSVLSADSAGTFFSYLKLLCHSLGIERDSAGDTAPGLTSTATDSADRSREGPSAPVQTIGRLSYDSGARSRVLAALFSHSPMWERVERIFTSGSSLIDAALDALGLLSAVMRDCPAEVVVEVMPRLHVLVSRAISSPARHDDRLSRALGGLLPALASRLGKASSINAGRGSRSGVSEDLVHPSHAVPWLDVPRVPSTGDILIASAMSSADCNLDRLCTQQLPSLKSGSYRGGRAEYLETLYRLLRADGLNKILAGVGALNRGIDVPDRDLRMYEDVRVVGYCAARGGL